MFGAMPGAPFERGETAQMPKNDAIITFVHQQNIERYRRLLRAPLDVRQRQAILNLLAQEEAAEQFGLAS